MKIGLGIVTRNRPEYFKQVVDGICEHLKDRVDFVCVYNDGTDYDIVATEYEPSYRKLSNTFEQFRSGWNPNNLGVGHAKSRLLKQMMAEDCDFLFISEDDVVVTDRGAVTQYVATAIDTGCHNLMFAHHGPENRMPPLDTDGIYEIYPSCVGAWVMYTRQAIERVGYMDEKFKNAWEHVEHTHRIIKQGMAPPFGYYMDVAKSWKYIQEIEGSMEQSVIRQDAEWLKNIRDGLYYWRSKDPEHFPLEHTIKALEGGQTWR